MHGPVQSFLSGSPFAVAGASSDRAKFGNKVLRAYMRRGLDVYPVNPNEDEIEGLVSYPDLASLSRPPHGVSIVTRPEVTARIVDDALALGVGHLWMQPGAEHDPAIELARAAGANVIAHGPCILAEFAADH